MAVIQKVTSCLWFDDQAEQAVAFYTAIFKHSKVVNVTRSGEAGQEIHGKPVGTVMTVAFELDGQAFTPLNGSPQFTFTEAVSFQVHCETQEEIDYYWEQLSAGGDAGAQQCDWRKDHFGVSWQIVPTILPALLKDPETAQSQRAMRAMLRMKKLDIEELKRAYAG